MNVEKLRKAIRDVPDFPRKGIIFKDITPLLADASLFREAVNLLANRHRAAGITHVCAVEARGFIFGAAVALELGAGFVPVRKKGKLPCATVEASFDLEYGQDTVQIHADAFPRGARVLLVDDVLATGGTAEATARLIQQLGGELVEIEFLIELAFLNGRARLKPFNVYAPIVYS